MKTFNKLGKNQQAPIEKMVYYLKSPSIISITLMLIIILIIPTFIVMLPSAKSAPPIKSEEVFGITNQSNEEIELPSVNVFVERSNSENIEKVPMETYVTSVVASEMPAEFELEALKAQAIAARTYIVNHLLHHEEEERVVITDTTEHQVYKNTDELKELWGKDFHWKMKKVTEAVDTTENEIITYDEQPITPTFFSMSNGFTEDAENYWGNELPYLKSVESKWEKDNPRFTEQKVFSFDEISHKTGISLPAGNAVPIQISRTPSNRVSEISFNGTVFTGKDIREKLELRSNDFSVEQKNNHFIFTTKGYGHGVGMSQYGANGMAEEGKTYEEIISHYYQDVEITTIKDAAPTLVAK